MNVQGVVKYVYDNRLTKDGTPNKFPNFKFKVNDQEIVLWSAIKPSFLEKNKTVSVTCGASKKNGSLFVLSKEDKTPMIQELPTGANTKPDTSFNVDDFEADNFNTAVTTIEKEINVQLHNQTPIGIRLTLSKNNANFAVKITKNQHMKAKFFLKTIDYAYT